MSRPSYDVVVVGDGPAGATTALYTTRLGHETAVVDRGGGRHTAVASVHNVQGVSEDVSGKELNAQAKAQLAHYGADYYTDDVHEIERTDDGVDPGEAEDESGDFLVRCTHHELLAERIVLATGFRDAPAHIHGLSRFTGRGLQYCLHCDAYDLIDESVYVLGCDDHAAQVAMLMLNFTADVDLLLDGDDPAWSEETDAQLRAHPVEVVETSIAEVEAETAHSSGDDHPRLAAFRFADGTRRSYRGGFAMYGSQYNAELAEQLGCERAEDGSIEVDSDGRTSVPDVYAVGDVTHGQNQTSIAMGNGARAGIAIHKELRRFPRSLDEIEAHGPLGEDEVPTVPEHVRERAATVREAETHPGLIPPDWEREG